MKNKYLDYHGIQVQFIVVKLNQNLFILTLFQILKKDVLICHQITAYNLLGVKQKLIKKKTMISAIYLVSPFSFILKSLWYLFTCKTNRH